MKLKQAMFLKTFESVTAVITAIEAVGAWPNFYVATSDAYIKMAAAGVVDTIRTSGEPVQLFLGKPIVILDVAL